MVEVSTLTSVLGVATGITEHTQEKTQQWVWETDLHRLTRVLPSDRTDAGVEQVPPHPAELVQQVAPGNVVGVPKALRFQALMRTQDRGGCKERFKFSWFSGEILSYFGHNRVDIQ